MENLLNLIRSYNRGTINVLEWVGDKYISFIDRNEFKICYSPIEGGKTFMLSIQELSDTEISELSQLLFLQNYKY